MQQNPYNPTHISCPAFGQPSAGTQQQQPQHPRSRQPQAPRPRGKTLVAAPPPTTTTSCAMLPPPPTVAVPPLCVTCQSLGMVYREKAVERIKTCALCNGAGLVRLLAKNAEGICWYCYGEGETRYRTVDGGWIECYCKQQPRRRPSQPGTVSRP
ncbi:hypothetical protein MY11210_000907 [Beauveria gryllotalpidicola]